MAVLIVNISLCQQKQKTMNNATNTIEASKLSLFKLQSPKYDDNIEKYGDNANTCIMCGKRIKNIDDANYVHMLTSYEIIASFEDHKHSQGCFPIGSDCAKKLSSEFKKKMPKIL